MEKLKERAIIASVLVILIIILIVCNQNVNQAITQTISYVSGKISNKNATIVMRSFDLSENLDGTVTGTLYSDNRLVISGNGAVTKGYYKDASNNNEITPFSVNVYNAYGCDSNISKIEIEEGITSIEEKAFYKLFNLSSVELPNSLITINDRVFAESKVSTIEIPSSVEYISNTAFRGGDLETIECNCNANYIRTYAEFNNYQTKLNHIQKANINGVCDSCNSSVVEIKSVDLSAELDGSVTGTLYSDRTLVIKANGENKSVTGGYYLDTRNNEKRAYYHNVWNEYSLNENISKVIIGEGITSIDEYAFYNFTNLKSISLPTTLNSIYNYSFGGYTSRKIETIEMPSNVSYISETAFKNIDIQKIITNCNSYGRYWAEYMKIKVVMSHNYEEINSVAATCINSGLIEHKCADCGNTKTEEIPATGHNYEWNITKSVTCTENGERTGTCTSCNDTKIEVIPATGHNYEWNITKSVTCTENGERTGTCTSCNDTKIEVIPATGHNYGNWVTTVEPTVNTKGEKTRTCSGCGKTETEETAYIMYTYDISAEGSNVAATIYQDGVLEISGIGETKDYDRWSNVPWYKISKNIKQIKIQDGITKIGSNLFSYCGKLKEVQIPDTLKTIGKQAFYNCSSSLSINIPITVTNIDVTAFNNTKAKIICDCDANYIRNYAKFVGQTLELNHKSIVNKDGICPNCNDTYIVMNTFDLSENLNESVTGTLYSDGKLVVSGQGTVSNGLGNNYSDNIWRNNEYGEYIKTIEIEDGITSIGISAFQYISNLTNVIISTSVENIQHNAFYYCKKLDNITIPASVTFISEQVFSSSLTIQCYCDSYAVAYADLLGFSKELIHNYELEYKLSTCAQVGYEKYKCTCCGDEKSITIPLVEHSYGEWNTITEPTCTENGIQERSCNNCGSKETKTIPALGHSYDTANMEITKEPTCIEPGIGMVTCDSCGETITEEEIPALGHNYGECNITQNATCTDAGLKNKTCHNCGEIVTEEIPAIGHNYGDWIERTSATCTTEGEKVRTCANCGDEKTEVIPVKKHNYIEWKTTKAATCYETGTKEHTCTLCGITETEEILALGHNFAEWAITVMPTNQHDGEKVRVCINEGCTEQETRTIAKTMSSYADISAAGDGSVKAYITADGTLEIVGQGAMKSFSKFDDAPWHEYAPYSNIKKVIIDYGVTNIGSNAFYDCNKLTEVEIASTVETIEKNAFTNCRELTQIEIPSSVTNIANDAFTSALKTIKCDCDADYVRNYGKFIGRDVVVNHLSEEDENGICKKCDYTENMLMSSYADISAAGDGSVKAYITADGTLEIVGQGAMKSFSKFDDAPWHEYAPYSNIKKVIIDYGVTNIGSNAFYDCNKLTEVEIASTVETIEKNAFTNCRELTQIEIPSSVTNIANDAFTSALKTITCYCNADARSYAKLNSIDTNLIHNYEREFVDSTCTQTGYEKYHCVIDECTEEIETKVSLKEHTYGDWTETKSATCIEVGERKNVCEVCGEEVTEEISALGHDYQVIRESTDNVCDEGGEIDYECSRCHNTYTEQIEGTGHTVVLDNKIEPTCTEVGKTEGSHCSVCGEIIVAQEEIPALGHNYEEEVIPPICTAEGYTTHTCTRCNDSYIDTYVEATGHSYGEVTYTWSRNLDTCTAKIECSICGNTEKETVNTTKQKTKEESCLEIGKNTYTAIFTNDLFTTQIKTETIERLGHTWGEWEVNSEEQKKTRTCSVCGATQTKSYYSNSVAEYDISANEDGSVIANLLSDGTGYTLLIEGQGKMKSFTNSPWIQDGSYSEIKKVVIQEGVTNIGSNAFYSCNKLTEVEIASTVTSIEKDAFTNCRELTQIEIPSSVTNIESDAFYSVLKTIKCYCDADYVRNYAEFTNRELILNHLSDADENNECSSCIYTENMVMKQYEDISAAEDKSVSAKITSDGTLTIEGKGAMKSFGNFQSPWGQDGSYSEIKKVIIQEEVTNIGSNAFYSCNKLTEVEIASTVTSIEKAAFGNCSELTQIEIPSSVINIASNAFSSALKTIICECGSYTHKLYVNSNVTKVIKHVGLNIIKEPTCIEKGTIGGICTICGETITEEEIPALGHTIEIDEKVEATCTETGLTEGKHCSVCGEVIVAQKTIPMSEHNYENITVVKEPTCISGGINLRTCSICGGTEQIDIQALGHDVEEGICTRCGENIVKTWDISATENDHVIAVLTDNNVLQIIGTGKMKNFEYDFENSKPKSPWGTDDLYSDINSIVIGYGVTNISEEAFADCKNVTHIEMPEGLTDISYNAFARCENLEQIEIPNSVTDIEFAAFISCRKLTQIVIPENVKKIEHHTFYGCTNLVKIVIPEGLTSIGDDIFKDCTSLKKIIQMNNPSIELIDNCIADNDNLIAYGIPGSILETYANNNNIEFVDVKSSNLHDFKEEVIQEKTCTEDGISQYKCNRCNYTYTETTVAGHIIENWDEKEATCIEAGIKKGVCSACNEEVIIETQVALGHDLDDNGLCSRCNSHIWDISATGKDHVIATLTQDGILQISGTGRMKDFEYNLINNSLRGTTAPWSTSSLSKSIKNIVITEGVTNIGEKAFSFCSSLTNIELPEGLTSINMNAFSDCFYLEEVIIPNSVMNIGSGVFQGCNRLIQIIIPENVNVIGDYTFYNCDNLRKIVVRNKDSIIKDNEFGRTIPPNENLIAYGYRGSTLEEYANKYGITFVAIDEEHVHEYAEEVIKEPTCEEAGEKKIICNICGYEETVEIPKLEHNYIIESSSSSSVCEDGGTITYKCSACNAVKTEEIAGTGHQQVIDETIEPTCATEGKTAGSHCSVCGKILDGNETIPALAHTIVTDEAIEPTCTTEGRTAGSHCSACGKILDGNETIPVLAHTIVTDKAKEATCTETGLTEGSHCGVCGMIIIEQQIIAKIEHQYQVTERTEATCEQKGDIKYECTICKSTYSEEILALGHDYEEEVTEATCTEGGYTTHTCTRCSNSYTDNETESTGHGYGDWVVIKAATCTEDGSKERICSVCRKKEIETIAALGHDYTEEWTIDKAATCTEVGSKSHHCTRCESKTDETEIPATGHTEVVDAAKAATCTETGLTEGKHCSVCRKVLIEQTEIPTLGHDYGEWQETKAATCEEDGSKERICSICRNVETGIISVLGHDYLEKWTTDKEATCTEVGSKSHHCTRCESKTDETEIPANGHTEVVDVVKKATCTETGLTEGKHCSVCGKVLIEQTEMPALGHDYGEWQETKAATCTEEGTKERVCSVCKNIETGIVDKLGHDYSEEWTIDDPGSCTEDIIKSKHCTRCDARKEITRFAPSGHKYASVVTEPTCTEGGYTIHTCTICGDSYKDSYVREKGHNYVIKGALEAICEQGGKIVYECTYCKDTYEEIIEAKGHTEEIDKAVAPTCTETGLTEGKHCSVCGTVLIEQTEISALGHNYSEEWTIDKEATCTEAGSKLHNCTRCESKTDETEIPALGHNYQIKSTTESVCEEGGEIVYECTRCGDTYTQTIEATGHQYSTEWIIDKEATCTEAGSKSHHCTRCDSKIDETEIPGLGHSFGEWIIDKEATYEEEGHKYRVCTNCNKEREEEAIPKLIKEDLEVTTNYETKEKDGEKFAIMSTVSEAQEILNNITSNKDLEIVDKSSNTIKDTSKVGTGAKVIEKETKEVVYVVVVKGDANGDAKIDFINDIIRFNNYRLNLIDLDPASILAGDIDDNGKIDFINDIIKINNYRLGITNRY